MIEVEVFGASLAPERASAAGDQAPVRAGGQRAGSHDGHVAVEFVERQRIARAQRASTAAYAEPTDVLSFPIDGAERSGAGGGPRELGDIVICPEHTADLREAVVHGMLHLLGMDHERDDGEMLALQRELLAGER